jgi:hypothetical protein
MGHAIRHGNLFVAKGMAMWEMVYIRKTENILCCTQKEIQNNLMLKTFLLFLVQIH